MPAPETCPECGSPRIEWDQRRREFVCQACGLVIEDEGQALEPSVPRDTPSGEAATGPRLPPRLRRAQKRAEQLSSSERRLIRAKQEVHRVATVLGCPRDVADQAVELIRQAREAGITQGRSLDAMAAASLMAACRMMHLVRTEEDMEAAASVPFEDIQNAYRALVKGLDLPIPPMTAHQYMAQLASQLDIQPPVEARAREILQKVCGTQQAVGKNPLGWAAAALVLASREDGQALSMNQAAEAADVSISTVRARLDELEALEEGEPA